MRVAALTGQREITLTERQRPEPGPEDVLVRLEHVGICGSDVHYYEQGRVGEFVVDYPLVLGHESAGQIVDVGERCSERFSVGEAVAIEPGVPCTSCDSCRRGRYNLCRDVTFMATPPDDGAFAEYVSWPAEYVYALPDGVSTRAGALCEPLSVGLHCCTRGDVGVGDTVLVTGAGPIGQFAAQVANAAGAATVIVSDLIDRKLDLAIELGADSTVNAGNEDLADTVAELTSGRGVDVVIEATGARPVIQSTTECVRHGGTVVFVGVSPEGSCSLDVVDIVHHEIDVRGSFRYANTYPAAIELLENGDVSVDPLVDFEVDLGAVEAAFERAMDESTVKGMIRL